MEEHRQSSGAGQPPVLKLPTADWQALASLAELERLLAEQIASRRWFGSKARQVKNTCVLDSFAIAGDDRLALVEVRFEEGPAEVYQFSLALAKGLRAEQLLAEQPAAVWARVELADEPTTAVLYEPLVDESFCGELLRLIEAKRPIAGERGELASWQTEAFGQARGESSVTLPPHVSRAEQSNTSIVYGDRLILKLFRRLEMGTNPDLELGVHLTRRGFRHTPPVAGGMEYRHGSDEPWALAALHQFVPNEGDAWEFTLRSLASELDVAPVAKPLDAQWTERGGLRMVGAANAPLPNGVEDALGSYLADAKRLGLRTAEMHLALAKCDDDPDFVPEPLSLGVQQQFADRTRSLVNDTFDLLRRQASTMSGETLRLADELMDRRPRALAEIKRFASQPINVEQIRCHGDYHLGQVLVADGDFMIIDFEGEPARSLAERRKKQLALRDVGGMIRSFHYASCAAATQAQQSQQPGGARAIATKAAAWYFWTSVAFLHAYRQAAQGAPFVPQSDDQFEQLLDACLLEKAVYELRYELNNRPDWVYLPLTALGELLA
jgi:maltose alpha-D-glucosyltransferase/alpha-amylase